MTGKGTLVVTNIVMLALGVVLIMFYDNPQMAGWVAMALGVLFLAPSLFSIIMLLFTSVTVDDPMYNPRYNLIPVIGGFSFGLVIMMNADAFLCSLKYLFAILMIVGGLYYVFYLLFARSKVVMPKMYYFLPSVVAVVGFIVLLFSIDEKMMFMMTGLSLVALTVTSVLIAISEYMAARSAAKAAEMEASANAEEVTAEPVDDVPNENEM